MISAFLKSVWKSSKKMFKTVLRFLNLLEPDVPYMVLSLSKLSVWMTLLLTGYVLLTGQGVAEVGGALIANVGAIANYAYRRHMQVRTRRGAYARHLRDDDCEPEPECDDNNSLDEPLK